MTAYLWTTGLIAATWAVLAVDYLTYADSQNRGTMLFMLAVSVAVAAWAAALLF